MYEKAAVSYIPQPKVIYLERTRKSLMKLGPKTVTGYFSDNQVHGILHYTNIHTIPVEHRLSQALILNGRRDKPILVFFFP